MLKRMIVFLAALPAGSSCVHRPLSASNVDRMNRPAFVSRIEEGPQSTVFREDDSYGPKLKKLDPKEADRRLQVKLSKGMTRFEISEGLRARTLALLPREQPWTRAVDQALVDSALESYLVEEVPANPPDYDRFRPLGADSVVEFVIERYGMRSKNGRAGAFIEGYGRLFFLDGGEVWRRAFRADEVESESPHVDPFKVAKEPELFRTHMATLLDGVARQFAKDLNPPDRQIRRATSGKDKATEAPTAPQTQPQGTELPEPDPI